MATKRQSREYFQLSADDKLVIKKLEILTSAVDKVYPSMKRLILRSFVQGLFVALGSTVGLSIIIALITFILVQTKNVPFLEKYIPEKQIEKVLPDTQ